MSFDRAMKDQSRIEFKYQMPMWLFIGILTLLPVAGIGIFGLAMWLDAINHALATAILAIIGFLGIGLLATFAIGSVISFRHNGGNIILTPDKIMLPGSWLTRPRDIPYTEITEIRMKQLSGEPRALNLKCRNGKSIRIAKNNFKREAEFLHLANELWERVHPLDER